MTLAWGEARVTVSLHGANVVSYIPSERLGEVIWTGQYKPLPGKDCWGGIPIVWPWFILGTGQTPNAPFHGPARFATWNVADKFISDAGSEVRLSLPVPQKKVDGEVIPLEAELRIRLHNSLNLQLITRNTGVQPYLLEHCFHAYFKVGDVTQIRIDGLEGTKVQDNRIPGARPAIQMIPITLDGPAARVYRPFPYRVTLEDPLLGRCLVLRSPEAAQLVLWNSGPIRKENGHLTGEAEWRTQIALEPLCGLEKAIELAPGDVTQLTMEIEAVALDFFSAPTTY